MTEFITMPKLSDTMEEGVIIKWHKSIGEKISEGDLLVEIETDKAIQEFESEFNGYILYIDPAEGKSAKINSLIAIIGDNPNLNTDNILFLYKKNINKNEVTHLKAKKKNHKRFSISPLANIIAKKKSFSLEKLRGSRRIIKRDIKVSQIDFLKNKKSIEGYLNLGSPNFFFRKNLAKKLVESKFTSPHYYLTIEIDMKNSIKSREILNKTLKEEEKISFNDFIIKAAALSLKKNPKINSSWNNNNIIYHDKIHIGIAISIQEGLLVPVIYNVDKKTLLQISLEIKEKVKKARIRKLSQKEMEGSTFTISNLGMFGIESFTSIINQPNSCILSIGAILDKPIINNRTVIAGHIMKVSLACDHRVIDGAIGSIYLQNLKKDLENPIRMLL